MVQCMESWFLADRDALEAFYGSQCFRKQRLPGRESDVERISKDDVLRRLHDASRDCRNGGYHKRTKVVHGNAIMAKLAPAKVRRGSRECERLFDALGLGTAK